MLLTFVHDFSPVMLKLGHWRLTWYDTAFALTIGLGTLLWLWQLRRGSYPWRLCLGSLPVGLLAFLLGARLGHCLFYDPERYLSAPLEMLVFWRGGYSSHGAGLALLGAYAIWARVHSLRFHDLFDRFVFTVGVGIVLVRFGNFCNCEVLGTPTDVPWAVIFAGRESVPVPRHPVQLYEMVLGLFVLGALFYTDRKAGVERRPVGLLAGALTTLYFAFRLLLVEPFKAPQGPLDATALTTGQWLCLPFVVYGVGLLVYAWKVKQRAGFLT